MIKRQNELRHERITDLKKGQGTVELVHILTEKQMMSNGRLFALNIIPPNGSIGLHKHRGDFETYYILKGEAEISDGENSYKVGSGDVAICEDGKFHSIKNVGNRTLEYIALILYTQPDKS